MNHVEDYVNMLVISSKMSSKVSEQNVKGSSKIPQLAKDIFDKSISEDNTDDLMTIIEEDMKDIWVSVDKTKALVKSMK